jgi:hypothetical protein
MATPLKVDEEIIVTSKYELIKDLALAFLDNYIKKGSVAEGTVILLIMERTDSESEQYMVLLSDGSAFSIAETTELRALELVERTAKTVVH